MALTTTQTDVTVGEKRGKDMKYFQKIKLFPILTTVSKH